MAEQKTLRECLDEKTDKRGPDECWEWTGAKQSMGYGNLGVGKKMKRAHRIVMELKHGPIPEGMCVCHTCDNPGCVNPAHLWVGTHAENMADMVKKGRWSRGGTMHPGAKLTEKQVLNIRERYAIGDISQRALAVEFGVSESQISRVINRKNWKHI